jgi:hypothetical protein
VTAKDGTCLPAKADGGKPHSTGTSKSLVVTKGTGSPSPNLVNSPGTNETFQTVHGGVKPTASGTGKPVVVTKGSEFPSPNLVNSPATNETFKTVPGGTKPGPATRPNGKPPNAQGQCLPKKKG